MGNNIPKLLEKKGWSIYRLNKKAGLSYNTTHNIATSEKIPPHTAYDTLRRIADALGVTIDDLED
jgi:lambda repressor-like predicted transcriptional regulator